MTFSRIQLSRTKTFKRLALAVVLVVLVAVAAMPENALAFLGLGKIAETAFSTLLASMANLMLSLVSWLVWIAGAVFNYSVDTTLNMNGLLANIPVVDIGWRIIRDIANIVFIFIALWSGISITLGLQAEKAWGLLAHMVLVALFINFSLFITKTIVDGTNIAALHFYNLMKDPTSTTDADAGISGAFMKGLKLQTLFNSKELGQGGKTDAAKAILQADPATKTQVSEWNIVLVGVFGSIFLVVTAFVFFAAAILFIIRAITLIMLMILSPLAFVAWILPGASGLASKWWSTLWSQAFFAPIYMALAYVVVATINSPGFGAGLNNLSFAAAFTSTSGGVHTALIFNFLILIGLMLGCLIVAQSLGGKGAELGMKWAKGVSKFGAGAIGGMALGAGGMLARGGLRAGEALASTDYMKKRLHPETLAKMKKWSVRSLDERWQQAGGMLGGQSAVGKWLREKTTGKLVGAKIAGKSVEEAHKEGQQMESARHNIALIAQARQNSSELNGFTNQEVLLAIREHEDRQRLHEARRALARALSAQATAAAQPSASPTRTQPQGNPPSSGTPPSPQPAPPVIGSNPPPTQPASGGNPPVPQGNPPSGPSPSGTP